MSHFFSLSSSCPLSPFRHQVPYNHAEPLGVKEYGCRGSLCSRCLAPVLRFPFGHSWAGTVGAPRENKAVDHNWLGCFFAEKQQSFIQTNLVIRKTNGTVYKHINNIWCKINYVHVCSLRLHECSSTKLMSQTVMHDSFHRSYLFSLTQKWMFSYET